MRTSLGSNRIQINDRHYMNSYDTRITYLRSFDDGLSGSIGASFTRQVLKADKDGNGTDKTGNTKGLTALQRQWNWAAFHLMQEAQLRARLT